MERALAEPDSRRSARRYDGPGGRVSDNGDGVCVRPLCRWSRRDDRATAAAPGTPPRAGSTGPPPNSPAPPWMYGNTWSPEPSAPASTDGRSTPPPAPPRPTPRPARRTPAEAPADAPAGPRPARRRQTRAPPTPARATAGPRPVPPPPDGERPGLSPHGRTRGAPRLPRLPRLPRRFRPGRRTRALPRPPDEPPPAPRPSRVPSRRPPGAVLRARRAGRSPQGRSISRTILPRVCPCRLVTNASPASARGKDSCTLTVSSPRSAMAPSAVRSAVSGRTKT